MKNTKGWIVFLCLVLLFCAVPWEKIESAVRHPAATSKSASVSQGKNPGNTGNAGDSGKSGNTSNTSGTDKTSTSGTLNRLTVVKDVYPYDIAKDRDGFYWKKADITVGDNHYMTQINDWFQNFNDYKNKSVVIEGFYLKFGKYTLVGRNGPTCPYCTGGYVDFEFKSDQDLSQLQSEKSWIRVAGILREGSIEMSDGSSQPMYYIEAIKVSKLEKEGMNPISD